MNPGFTHSSRRIYQLVAGIWLLLFVAVGSLIVRMDIQRAERVFNEHVIMHWQRANDRAHINESILEGFSAMVSASSYLDRGLIRSYAKELSRQYPHIFMFEIVEQVADHNLASFTEYYRRSVYPDFEVKAFGYETDRQWRAVGKVPYHMPIVFMEPFLPESRQVLGLDLSSNRFFMRALEKSRHLNRATASEPFTLVEGDLAYLLLKPIPLTEEARLSLASESGATGEFAVLVLRTDTLLDSADHVLPGMRELLYSSAFSSTDPRGYLHLHQARQPGWLESRLFPCLKTSKILDSDSQPFVLLIEQQLGWSVVSWGKLGLTLLVAVITFVVMVLYARLYFRNEMERAEMTVRLFHLANHDALTGLANRNLLTDRLNHAISQTARHNGQLAVMFLDLEKFKDVNDTYGHDVGDRVLTRAAERLRACVRAGDTIARLGGDEFVLVLENINGRNDVEQVVGKVKAGFEQPFEVDSHPVKLGISIGVAMYPMDGMDIDSLLSHADTIMYRDKHAGK